MNTKLKNATHKLKAAAIPYCKADLKAFKDMALFDDEGKRRNFVVSRTHNLGNRKSRRAK